MEKCPPEIHSRIFDLACSDGGTTGRSLSAVSKWFRAVSTPYQWQSLAIQGQKQAFSFYKSLQDHDRRNPHQRRRIHHLFITDHIPRTGPTADADIHKEALEYILTYAAPTLDTFTYFSTVSYMTSATYIATILGVVYPNLTELTIRGRCTPMQIRSLTTTLPITPTAMPNLRRLHLALPFQGLSSGNFDKTQALVHTIAPHLTHFRLTLLDMWGSKRVSEIIHAELAQMRIVPSTLHLPPLAILGEDGRKLIPVPRVITAENVVEGCALLPPNLTVFALQPSPTRTFYCSCCMEYKGDVDVIPIFEKLSELAELSPPGGSSRFVYLGRKESSCMGYGPAEAKLDWLERIGNGDGCWRRRMFTVEEEGEDRHSSDIGLVQSTLQDGNDTGSNGRLGSPRSTSSSLRSLVSKLKI